MKTEQTQDGTLMETVTLIMPHTHAGRDYKPGEQIDVTAAQKAWLLSHEIIINEIGEQPCPAY